MLLLGHFIRKTQLIVLRLHCGQLGGQLLVAKFSVGAQLLDLLLLSIVLRFGRAAFVGGTFIRALVSGLRRVSFVHGGKIGIGVSIRVRFACCGGILRGRGFIRGGFRFGGLRNHARSGRKNHEGQKQSHGAFFKVDHWEIAFRKEEVTRPAEKKQFTGYTSKNKFTLLKRSGFGGNTYGIPRKKRRLFKNVIAQTYGTDMSTTTLKSLLAIFVILDYYVTLGVYPWR